MIRFSHTLTLYCNTLTVSASKCTIQVIVLRVSIALSLFKHIFFSYNINKSFQLILNSFRWSFPLLLRRYCKQQLKNVLPINETDINYQLIIRRSPYNDLEQFNNFAKENNTLNILNTIILSINATFSEIEAFIEELYTVNFKVIVIYLQGDMDRWKWGYKQFHLQGFDCIS